MILALLPGGEFCVYAHCGRFSQKERLDELASGNVAGQVLAIQGCVCHTFHPNARDVCRRLEEIVHNTCLGCIEDAPDPENPTVDDLHSHVAKDF